MSSNDSPRFRISLVQLIASALAAVTAAVAASYLGVNGTVIGAAVASVCSVAGTAIYSHSLQRTGQRVRSVVPASARWLPEATLNLPVAPPADTATAAARTVRQAPPPQRRLHPLARIAAASVIVFAAALGVVTSIELAAGRPVSDLVSGKQATGTTVFGSQLHTTTSNTPVPAVTVTVTPSVVVTTPTVTQTAPAVTVTSTPTVTPSPSTTPSDSGTPTNTPVP